MNYSVGINSSADKTGVSGQWWGQAHSMGHCNSTLALLPKYTTYMAIYSPCIQNIHAVRSTAHRYSICCANMSLAWCSSQDDYQILADFGLCTLPHMFGHNLPWGLLWCHPVVHPRRPHRYGWGRYCEKKCHSTSCLSKKATQVWMG